MAVALAEQAVAETERAFDGVAADYDRSNTENGLLVRMRARVLARLRAHAPVGARVLDLGCGPGTDAAALVASGFTVTAIDLSARMVAEARQRVRALGLQNTVDVRHLAIQDLDRLAPARFDVAYSNFGPLNCVPDLTVTARQIAARLNPGGVFVASVIGRVCPWELALYALRCDWIRWRVRFATGPVAVPLEGHRVWTRYHAPAAFQAIFESVGFTAVSCEALGLFAPPPYLDHAARRHPRLIAALERLDQMLGGFAPFRHWGDHFLIVMRKGPA